MQFAKFGTSLMLVTLLSGCLTLGTRIGVGSGGVKGGVVISGSQDVGGGITVGGSAGTGL